MKAPVALSLAGAAKSYPSADGPKQILADVSFDVGEGELVCIVGPSGAGKSTLLRCVAGLLPLTSGSVALNGRVVDRPPAEMALVFQDYSRSLMPWMSVLDNVTLPLRRSTSGRARREDMARSALDSVGLDGAADLYPWQMSGGMQQRAAIARAIAYQPRVLLMDEPFASVDAQTRSDLEDLTLRIRDEYGITIVVVTHDIDEAVYLSDRVVVLGGRPATVRACLDVALTEPRDQVSTKAEERFVELRTKVLKQIRNPVGPVPATAN